jgi:hypothetical protein
MSLLAPILTKIEEIEDVFVQIERVLFTKRYNLSKKHIDIFSIQSVSMIYSIWEGFIQFSFSFYIDKINDLQLDFNLFIDKLQTFHMENTFKQFMEYPQNVGNKVKFYDSLQQFYNNPVTRLYNKVNTQSNVGFAVLNVILETFGLMPFPPVWKQYKHPQLNLKDSLSKFLKYRNAVSHGGDISSEESVTQAVYTKYRQLILDLMYEIYTKMESGLQDKTFLKN